MRLCNHETQGDRGNALKEYDFCRRLLKKEKGTSSARKCCLNTKQQYDSLIYSSANRLRRESL